MILCHCDISWMAASSDPRINVTASSATPIMTLINLNTASLLSGVSKRTLWRRIAAGSLSVSRSDDPQGRTLISLADIAQDIGIPLNGEVIAAIRNADAGLARDQLELALTFLEVGQTERALPWLQIAAAHGDVDAMLTLGEIQLDGPVEDPTISLNWIRRAAIAGHPLALAIMEALPGQLRRREGPAE